MGASFAEEIIKEAVTQAVTQVEARVSRQTAVACIKKGMVDSDISEVSFLPITEVAKIRAELGIPAFNTPRELALVFIKDGFDDSFVSKYSRLSIEEVAKIRAEVEADPKTK